MSIRKKASAVTVNETAGATPGSPATPRRVYSSEVTALRAVLGALDGLDKTTLLAAARKHLARGESIRGDFATARQALRDRYSETLDQVLAGKLTTAAALDQLAALAPVEGRIEHTAGTLAARLEDDVAAAAEAQAVAAARREGPQVHTALHQHAQRAVTAATDAARQVVDLPGYTAAVKRAIESPRWDQDSARLAGYPHLDLAAVPPRQYGSVGQLRTAMGELEATHDAARLLRAMCPGLDSGTGSVLYAAPPRRDDESYVLCWTPSELVIPLAHELGWKPGLWLRSETKPRPDAAEGKRGSRMPGHHEQLTRDLTSAAVTSVPDQQAATRAGDAFGALGRFLPSRG